MPEQGEGRRQRSADFRSVDRHGLVEGQGQLALSEIGRDIGAFGRVENQAVERRQDRGAHGQRSRLRRLARHLLGPCFRQPQPIRELGQRIGRRAGHDTRPVQRQQVDESPVACLDQIGAERLCQRKAQAAPVGVHSCDGDIGRQLTRDLGDIDRDRLGKGDDQDAVGNPHARGGRAIEVEREAAKALLHRLALKRRAGRQSRGLQLRPQGKRSEADTEEKGTRNTQTGKLTQRRPGDSAGEPAQTKAMLARQG